MPTITSAGIGSGLDVSSIVESLVAAEKEPTSNALDERQATLDAKISAYGELQSALSSYQNDLSTLKRASTFNSRAISSSNDGIVSASVNSLADPGTTSIEVTQLAEPHTIVTGEDLFSSQEDVIGTGSITIRYGSTSYDPDSDIYTSFTQDSAIASDTITIDSSNNTLATFRDYVNQGDYGVTATIVNDGSSFRLLLASNTGGASNSMEITTTDTGDGNDTDNAGLSRLAFNSNATQMDQTLEAKSAQLTVNGLAVERDTNNIDDVINGVTLDLKQATPGTKVTLAITQDSSGIKEDITSFVDSFNGLFEKIGELTASQTDLDEDGIDDGPGILLGDSFTRNIQFQLRRITGAQVEGLTGAVTALADLGITTNYNIAGQVDGTLGINETTLDEALSNNLDSVSALFAPQGTAAAVGVDWVSSNTLTESGSYALNVTTLATQGSLDSDTVLNSFPLAVTSSMDDFTVRVDGELSGALQITNQSYSSGAELAAEIQAQINSDSNLSEKGISVSVSFDTDKLVVTSSKYGSASSVAFTSVDTDMAANIGFSQASGTAGVNVAGTINGQEATGDGQFLLSSNGVSSGLKALITGTTTGDLGNIIFTRGIATDIDGVVEGLIGLSGSLPGQVSGLENSLFDIADERESLDFRMEKLEARLAQQFSVMDRLVANLQNTSSFLTQQFAAISGNNN